MTDPERRTRLRAAITTVIALAAVGLLVWVAPPGQVFDQISDMNPDWVLAAVGLELASCIGYVIVFRRFFPEPPSHISRQVAWIAMGAGAVLPGGNISSAAATGWLLREYHLSTRELLERCGALLLLITLFGFCVNGLSGTLLLAGIPDGPHDLLHTGGPILVSIIVLSAAALLMRIGCRVRRRRTNVLTSLGTSLEHAWQEATRPHWRLLGGVAFFCLDIGALAAACAATGDHIGLLAIVLAYCIGYLTTLVPVPAGLGVLDSGLAGTLVLYGMHPAASVGAVLVYHAISIWVPGLGGLLAWLPTRRAASAAQAQLAVT
jgi:uncharacterized membrane protein YbhN (UPF0104 family)